MRRKKYTFTILALMLMLHIVSGFTFKFVDIATDTSVINKVATYNFTINRAEDSGGLSTAWTTPVPAGSNITIKFPPIYNTSYGYSCFIDNINYTCSPVGQNVIITGYFTTSIAVQTMSIIVSNILNPSPASQTAEFVVTVGIDVSDTSSNNFAAVQLQSDNFTACSITFTPNTLNKTNVAMIIHATPQNPIPSTGYIVVTYPTNNKYFYDIAGQNLPVSNATCTNYSTNVNQLVSCTAGTNAAGANTLTATSLFNTANTAAFAIQINGQLSPPTTAPKDQFVITSMQNGDPIDVCVTTVSGLQPTTIPVTITSSNTTSIIVNRQVTLRIGYTVSDTTNNLDSYTLVFPTGSKLTAPTIGGNIVAVNVSLNGNTVSFSQSSTIRTFNQSSSVFFTMSNYTAPPSTQQTGAITLTILRDSYSKMVGTATIIATLSTLNFTVTPSSLTVNQNTSYLFNITINDGLLSSGRIKIDFPSSITQSWISPSCATVSGSSMTTSPICALASGSGSLILSSLNLSASNIGAQTFNVLVNGIVNPPSTQPSGNFNITTYYSSTDDTSVASGSMGAVTATASTLNSSTVVITPSSYVVMASGVTYTISFQNNNPIPTNGYIVLGIPYGVTAQIGSVSNMCFASTSTSSTPSSTTCTGVDTGTMYTVTYPSIFSSSGVAANNTITLRITSIFTNPLSTEPVSSFSISTYTSGGFLIDQLNSGLSVKMTTPADFTTTTVTAASNLNSDITSYTITLAQPSTLDSNPGLAVTFPPEITPLANASCTSLTSVALTCSVNGQVVTVTLGSGVSKSSFGVIIANVKNGPSLKPNSKFGFATITKSGLGFFSQNLATVSVTNSRPSSFKSISASFSPQILKSAVTASIIFTPTSDITGYAMVSLASSFAIGSLSCTSVAFTGSCSVSSSPNLLNVTGSFAKQSMTLSISGLTSPQSIPNDYTVFTTYDSSNYIIDQSATTIQFTISCTLPCRTCSSEPTHCLSCYNDTAITQSIYFNSITNKCVVICDSGYYADNTQLQCLACSSICLTCTITNTNCTSCNSSTSFPYLNKTSAAGTCLANCDSGMYPDSNQSPTLCVNCVTPCVTCKSQTSCLSCITGRYLYLTGCVTTCPSNTSVANASTNVCDPCDAVCATCSGTASNCTSCATNAALYNGNCVSTCPTGLVIKNGACVSCDSPCASCTGTSTNCTSCLPITPTPHLYLNTCVAQCPAGFFNDTISGDCTSCTSVVDLNCSSCSSRTTCITCDAGFVFLNSSCLATVPPGYVNISGKAEPCTGDCATCSVVQANCTSCKTNFLSNFQCVAICPNYSAPVSGICTACTSPCSTCSQLVTNCTSCLSSLSPAMYLSGNQCITSCPSYTYPNSTSYQCTSCVSPCVLCQSLSSCLSCTTGYNLYLKSCLQTCPSGFTAIASVCVSCTSPCLTCSTSQTTCTSCLSNLSPQLFLTDVFCVEASQCPLSTYANLTNNKCTACISPCATCSSATTCLSCITDYNLEGTLCKSSCQSGYTPVNSVCTPCTSPCATCAATTTTCLSCVQSSTTPLFLSGYHCLATCPAQTYANSSTFTCASCISPCDTCSSSTACISCVAGNYLFSNGCSKTCPLGYIGISTTCEKCATGCRACQNTTGSCTSCLANYYLLASSSECIQTCPSGLFADPTTGTCVGCTAPCQTCSVTTSNCTSCSSGHLYQNTCVTNCPASTYLFNFQCQNCQSGCSACTSATDCQSCFSGQYLYNNGCVTTCPSSAAVIVNSKCTECSAAHCMSCNSGDYCLVCSSPYALYLGSCLSECPTNFTSNGTNCVDSGVKNATDTLNNTMSSSKMFPLPFSIGGAVAILFCVVSKFQNSNTFASGAIYALLGLCEWGALGVFGFLYWQFINWGTDLLLWILVGSMGVIYLLNFVTFILLLSVYRSDCKFQAWLARSCSSRGSFAAAILISLFCCHKYCNILFTRLFGFISFKAQLQSVQKFYSLHVVSFLSLFHSVSAIGAASYISYYNSSSMSQLFLSGLDVIVITVINLIMTGANSQKDDSFFVEKEGDISLNKKILDNDQYLVDGADPDGVISQKGQAYLRKKNTQDLDEEHDPYQSDSQNSINVMLKDGNQSAGEEMVVHQSIGDDAANPPALGAMPANSRSRSRASKSRSSHMPPLPPNFKSKTQPQYNEEIQRHQFDVDHSQSGSSKKLTAQAEEYREEHQQIARNAEVGAKRISGASKASSKRDGPKIQKSPSEEKLQVSRADVSIQAYEMLSNQGSVPSIRPPSPPVAVGVQTSFDNIFDIPKVDHSVQGSKVSRVDRSQQFSVAGKDESIQLSNSDKKSVSVRDHSIQNSNKHNLNDQSMQYQRSMLSQVSKKHTMKDQSAQGTIIPPPQNSFGVQKTISYDGKEVGVQRTIGYNEASIQNTIHHPEDKSVQGTLRGKDQSAQGTIHRADDKSVQGGVSLRNQSVQPDQEYKTINPSEDAVSMRSFGVQNQAQGKDQSMQEGGSVHDRSDQYDQVVEVVNKSLQNSQVGSQKSVQNDPLLREDRSVQMSQKQYNDAPVQQKPAVSEKSVQETPPAPPNINYKSIEESISANDTRQHHEPSAPEKSDAHVLDRESRMLQTEEISSVSDRNEKEIQLEKMLREKEMELGRIRKEVQLKERENLMRKSMEKEREEKEAKLRADIAANQSNFKKKPNGTTEMKLSNNFMKNSNQQEPLEMSQTLKRSQKIADPLKGLDQTSAKPGAMSGERQESSLPQNLSRAPPAYQNHENINTLGTTLKPGQQLPLYHLDDASNPLDISQKLPSEPNEQPNGQNRSSSKTIEQMKEMLDELKDNHSRRSGERGAANNFTFNKDQIQVTSRLSEEDLQHMRSLKSEMSNSNKGIDVIEEVRDEHLSDSRQRTKRTEQDAENAEQQKYANFSGETAGRPEEVNLEKLQPAANKNSQPIMIEESDHPLQTSNQQKTFARTKKTKGQDTSKQMFNTNRYNNANTDDSGMARPGTGGILMKDILSEPQNNRLKFKNKVELNSPQIEEKQIDLNLSSDEDVSQGGISRGATEVNPTRLKPGQRETRPKGRFQYEQTNKQHEDHERNKFSIDNDDIEKSVRESEDQLYKQPISFFPQTKNYIEKRSEDSDLMPGFNHKPDTSEHTIEQYRPSMTPQPVTSSKAKPGKKIPRDQERQGRHMMGPIILTAGGRSPGKGDSGDKRLSKPSNLKKSPLKDEHRRESRTMKNGNQPEILMSDTELSDSGYDPIDRTIQNRSNALTQQSRQQSDRIPHKKQKSPPKKFDLMYETSEQMGQHSVQFGGVGISPTEFNQYNQRYEDQRGNSPHRPGGPRNDMPMKPQIITRTVSRDMDARRSRPELSPVERDQEIHKRVPMMVNTLGIQEQDRQPQSRGRSREGRMRATMNVGPTEEVGEYGEEELKDYYGTKGLKPKEMKVDRELEKIYLQRQYLPKKAGKPAGRSTSRDKL